MYDPNIAKGLTVHEVDIKIAVFFKQAIPQRDPRTPIKDTARLSGTARPSVNSNADPLPIEWAGETWDGVGQDSFLFGIPTVTQFSRNNTFSETEQKDDKNIIIKAVRGTLSFKWVQRAMNVKGQSPGYNIEFENRVGEGLSLDVKK